MKWFMVYLFLANSNITAYVDDSRPFDTPVKCNQAVALLQANAPRELFKDARVVCAGNDTVARFMFGAGK